MHPAVDYQQLFMAGAEGLLRCAQCCLEAAHAQHPGLSDDERHGLLAAAQALQHCCSLGTPEHVQLIHLRDEALAERLALWINRALAVLSQAYPLSVAT